MKVMLLAAGRGERLRPLTDTTPKPLLKINKASLITRHLNRLHAADFFDIVINVSHLGEKIIRHVGDGPRYSSEKQPLEAAGGVCLALEREMLDKHKAFALINADIFCDYDYSRLRAGAKTVSTTKSCHLILAANPPEHPQGDFSLSANGVLLPPHGDTYTYTGIGVFHPSLFEKLKAEEKHKLLPILQAQIKKQKATAEIHDGLWHDTGTPAALARARKHWKI
ncbi:MAG: nucleotidyltransferase family protein [Candidatus Zeuxoniibacter abyssi]|nr:MAG: nucleotidyltransferase family protein [Candidatus Persebacteraceae bacterium AB1(2)]